METDEVTTFDPGVLTMLHGESKRTDDQVHFAMIDSVTEPKLNRYIQLDHETVAVDIWKFVLIEPKNVPKTPFIKFDGIYWEGVYRRLEALQFRKRRTPGKYGTEIAQPQMLIHVDGAIIQPVEPGHIMNEFRRVYIEPLHKPEAKPIEVVIKGVSGCEQPLILSETFTKQQNSIINTSNLLSNLQSHNVPELSDTRNESYYFFSNEILKVTKSSLVRFKYSDVTDTCIWRGRIINRTYHEANEPGGHFERFIRNVSRADSDPKRYKAFRSAIGYLLHNHNSSAQGQAVISYDESPSKKNEPAGGTGKGLFANGIKQLRNTAKIDGKSIDENNRFKWQEVNLQTQLIWIDDPKTSFKFETLFSCLTDGWNIEQKGVQTFYIPPEDSPKVLICTNSAIANSGSSNKRRQFIIEFSNHYQQHIVTGQENPIENEHGCIFFSEHPEENWNEKDWQQFFSFMLDCVQFYLKNGLVTYEFVNVNHNQLVTDTSEEFAEWLVDKKLNTSGLTDYNKAELFSDFSDTYLGKEHNMKQITFTNWLKKWGMIYGIDINQRKSDSKNLITFKDKRQK